MYDKDEDEEAGRYHAGELRNSGSMIDALGYEGAKIFQIQKIDRSHFELKELCDEYYKAIITRAELCLSPL